MSATQDWSGLRRRLAGKWQAPLLTLALALFAATIYRTRPNIAPASFPESLAHLDDLVNKQRFPQALFEGRKLSGQELTSSERAQVELRLGRARFGILAGSIPSSNVAVQIVRHFRAASPALEGPPLSAEDQFRLGRLMEWQSKFAEARHHLNLAIASGHPQPDELRKEIYILDRDRLEAAPAGLMVEIQNLLSLIEPHRLDVRMWAVEERLHLAERLKTEDSAEFLDREAEYFSQSDFESQFEFLRCRLLADQGHDEQAQLRLRALRSRLEPTNQVSAMAGWLLGRVLLRSPDPQRWEEALSFFTDVVYASRGPYAAASRTGQAEALARLGRHEEALATYADAAQQRLAFAHHPALAADALASSLAITAEALRQQDDLDHSLAYAQLAVQVAAAEEPESKSRFLLPLALLEVERAEQVLNTAPSRTEVENQADISAVDQHAQAARLFDSAASRYEELAQLAVHDEPQSADFWWRAAELFSRGTRRDAAVERLRQFAQQRPEDRRVPTALLRIGQLQIDCGRFEQAAQALEECHQRYPRSLDGARALVPLAWAYMYMDPPKLSDAQAALRNVLEDSDVFTPVAGEFAESLFLLGEVLQKKSEFDHAISALREALDRYPDHQLAPRGRYFLAGAFRQSAHALLGEKSDSKNIQELEAARAESMRRLRESRKVYRQLIEGLERRPWGELNELERLYLQYSYLYEADCCLETQDYAEAVRLYEEASGLLRDSAGALSAHVQVVRCHVFMGEPKEAGAALSRAMIFAKSMPESAFATRIGEGSRGDWNEYFEWLKGSGLF